MGELKPFWTYYGGKWRAAPRYPKPRHMTIVEPFAGSAGYALRYPEANVILVERYAVVAEMWRWLIAATPANVNAVPVVDAIDELPAETPPGARFLVGFTMNAATTHPCRVLSAGRKKLRAMGRHFEGWTEERRARVAYQVTRIKHWRIIEGDYSAAPDVEATWFVDPPYNNGPGARYAHGVADYPALGEWCRSRRGQVIVCENEGASWLPFSPFATLKPGVNGAGSREVVWSRPTPEERSEPRGITKEDR